MRGWAELRRREIDHARESRAVRSLDQSSLGITVLDGERRAKLRRASGAVFGLHQPYVVRLLWRLGAFALTPKLYGLSQTLVGR